MGSIQGEIPVGDEQEGPQGRGVTLDEALAVVGELVVWEAWMGGWDNDCWTRARGLVKRLVRPKASETLSDAEALDRIAEMTSGVEWDSDLAWDVLGVVRQTGREISDPSP